MRGRALPGVAGPELRLKVVGGIVKEVALGGGKAALRAPANC
ncbi:hypothetical protein [Nannocystis pusilla]